MKYFKTAATSNPRLRLTAAVVLLVSQILLPLTGQAQKLMDAPPNAVTLSVRGKCGYSADGATFTNMERGLIVEQGAVIRTGDNGRTDLFLRRTGTTIRVQPGSEIKLETMTVTMKDGAPDVYTLLDLRAGRIFTVVRSDVAGSVFEVKNAAGRSRLEGSGVGRYIITADGTHVAAKGSVIPLKVVGESGVTVVEAGQQFSRANGKMLPADPNSWVKDFIELDELASAGDASAKP